MSTEEKKESYNPAKKADVASSYEMNRCVKNQSREEVKRRLQRSALPLALLGIALVLLIIFQ